MRLLGTVVAGLLALSAQAQQLAGTQMFVDYPGLSDNCKDTLATNVTCPPLLLILSQRNRLLNEDEVGQLCTDDCHSSLKSARAAIEKSCTLDTDVLVFEEVAYPASFIVDQYLLAYDVSCQKDNAGHYCDPQLLSSRYKTNRCSTCWLNSLKAQLNSPLGYDEGLAENFDSLTVSCNATGYSYTSPTAYALNATSTATSVTATATPTQTCARSYKIQPEDDCNSVAKAMNVSTYYLLEANHLDLYCQTFANKVGKILCVPPQCTTHTWGPYDTCDEVVAGLDGVTLPQFLAWNPNFNSLCLNSPFFIGYEVCISPSGGYLNYASGNESSPTGTSGGTNLVAAPTNAMDSSNHNCSQWYTVEKGDTCADLSVSQSISLTDFYFLNPEVNQNCTNLQLGEAYCVRPVGSISSYPNYTATGGLPITVTSPTFPSVNTDIPTRTSDPGFIYTPPPAPPKAPGSISDCYKYDYIRMDDTTCDFLSFEYNVPFDDLAQWNPSLDKTKYNCTLSPEYSYCVKRYENSTVPEDTTTCLSINATEPGTASNCNCFTYVDDYDKGDYTCDDIIDSFDISLSQLLAWNTWLAGSDCTAALFANLGEFEDRSVCVGAGDPGMNTASTSTRSEPASTTSTESEAV